MLPERYYFTSDFSAVHNGESVISDLNDLERVAVRMYYEDLEFVDKCFFKILMLWDIDCVK